MAGFTKERDFSKEGRFLCQVLKVLNRRTFGSIGIIQIGANVSMTTFRFLVVHSTFRLEHVIFSRNLGKNLGPMSMSNDYIIDSDPFLNDRIRAGSISEMAFYQCF